METPFVFGKIATDKNFTDREHETITLVESFKSLVNTVIISPRRWGKSSLVDKAARQAMAADKSLRVCQLDLFNIRNEEHFYTLLAQKVIAATSTKWEEAVNTAKEFLSGLVPKISIGTDPTNEILLDFDWEYLKKDADEILDLAETIARKRGLKIVICIDEFQNISEFDSPGYFQKRLRSHWQKHQHVAYCLYGSKRHLMMEVFTSSSMPFYKFGNLMFLKKIDAVYLVDFFKQRFEDTGKYIEDDACEFIAKLVDNHPYYAQQLAQLSWLRTTTVCTVETVTEAHTSLVEQLSLLFVSITETLTSQQLNLLKAILAGDNSFSSAEVLHRYRITSATSAMRSRNKLIEKDILDNEGGSISFQDPIYAYWLKKVYFEL